MLFGLARLTLLGFKYTNPQGFAIPRLYLFRFKRAMPFMENCTAEEMLSQLNAFVWVRRVLLYSFLVCLAQIYDVDPIEQWLLNWSIRFLMPNDVWEVHRARRRLLRATCPKPMFDDVFLELGKVWEKTSELLQLDELFNQQFIGLQADGRMGKTSSAKHKIRSIYDDRSPFTAICRVLLLPVRPYDVVIFVPVRKSPIEELARITGITADGVFEDKLLKAMEVSTLGGLLQRPTFTFVFDQIDDQSQDSKVRNNLDECMRLSHVMRLGEEKHVRCKMVALFKTLHWSDQFDALNGGSLFVYHRLNSPEWITKDLVSLEEKMQDIAGRPKLRELEHLQVDNIPTQLKVHPFAYFLKDLHKGVMTGFYAKTVPQGEVKNLWVQLVVSPENPTKPSTATAFKVSPKANDIDGLKDAVKAKNPQLGYIPSWSYKVYARIAEGVWEEVPRASTPLTANTEESAYHVVVQKIFQQNTYR